jgi:hypothetical protein
MTKGSKPPNRPKSAAPTASKAMTAQPAGAKSSAPAAAKAATAVRPSGGNVMACSLSPASDESSSHFTAQPGPVTLKAVPTQGNILFTSHCAINDEKGNSVAFTLQNSNQGLQFTAAKGHTYTLFLPFAFLPSTSFGQLVEDCTGSKLNLPLININFSITLVIDC